MIFTYTIPDELGNLQQKQALSADQRARIVERLSSLWKSRNPETPARGGEDPK